MDLYSPCPRVDNVDADEASRQFHEDSQWQLNPMIFNHICETFGRPEMDLFASRLNWLIKPYCAWQPDPEADVIDSFTISWGEAYIMLSHLLPW